MHVPEQFFLSTIFEENIQSAWEYSSIIAKIPRVELISMLLDFES